MENLDFYTKKVTTAWITSVLIKNGFLTKGEVFSVKQESKQENRGYSNTKFYSLRLKYTPDSLGVMPEAILMKIITPLAYNQLKKEIDFYEAVSRATISLPLVTCYGAGKSPETNHGFLLFEDLTRTHHQPLVELPPPQDQCKEAIATLSKMHGYWLNHSSFGDPYFELPSEEWLRGLFQLMESFHRQFVAFLGDRLSQERKKIFELVFTNLPGIMMKRFSESRHLTLVHGDAHFWNFLFPNSKSKNQCVIIDWQAYRVGLGAADLSYMMVLFLDSEYRKRKESNLIEFYLEELQRQNIIYDREEFQIDYRVHVIFNLLYPSLWRSKFPPDFWWTALESGFAAFDDLDCIELLQ